RPAQDLVLLFQNLVTFTQLTQLRRLGGGDTRAVAVLDIGQLEPPVQTRLGNPEVLRDLRQRRLALTGDRDHVTAELGGECFRHDRHPSSEEQILTGQESTEPGADPNDANAPAPARSNEPATTNTGSRNPR